MRRKCVKISAIMAAMALMLTGCGGSFPNLTQEETQLIGEYAASLLLKYDVNHSSRLVSREEVQEAQLQQDVWEEIPSESTQEGMDPVEDTPVINVEPESGTDSEVKNTGNLEKFYGLPEGIVVTYQGNEVCDSYPPDDGVTCTHFALDATEGKRLLVLKFNIENKTQSEQEIDMLNQQSIISATINGSYTRNTLVTMLLDDMSTFVGNVPAGGSVDLVLLVEADDDVADNISSLMLNFKNESKTCTIQLK